MSNVIIIRPATQKDVESMVILWTEFMDFHSERDPWFKRSDTGHLRFAEFVAERIADEKSIVLVAEVDGKIVGHAIAEISSRLPVYEPEDYGQIMDVAIAETHRRSGIGEKLVEELFRIFHERGIRRVEVGMSVSNESATAFWRKMGFVPYMQKSWRLIDESEAGSRQGKLF